MPHVASTSPKSGTTTRLTRFTVMALGIATLALLFLTWLLLEPVYGKSFSRSWWPFVILLPGTICWLVLGLFNADIEGRGRPGLASFSSIVAGVSTVVLDFVLIPPLGVIGAALACSIANTLGAMCGSVIFSRLSGERIFKSFIPLRTDVDDLKRIAGEVGTFTVSTTRLFKKRIFEQ
jgi:O-antigen/teichoic acid export membrane protein